MLGHERLELAYKRGVGSAGQVCVDAVLEQRQPQLFEPAYLPLRERIEGELGERRPTPDRQRLPQLLGGPSGVVTGQSLTTLMGQAVASVEVELAGVPRGAGSRWAESPVWRTLLRGPC